MRKRWQKATACTLAAVMALSMAGCGKESAENGENSKADNAENQEQQGQEAAGIPEWLDTSGNLPLVKEGTEKTLEVAIQMAVDSGDPEDMWMYKFIEENMNINLEVTKFTSENINEFLSLTFADGDLPDVIIGGGLKGDKGLSASDLITYGAIEGQILDLAPYINEENMPNLSKLYAEHPEYKDVVTDTEGHVWSLGYINDPTDRGQIPRAFINYQWLEDAGLAVPTTVDEFVDALRAFKKRGDDIIPLGGVYNSNNPSLILLAAYGYNTTDPKGLQIALRDGKVVLPVADREAYGEYLKTMNTIYSEGLMDPNFYTSDSTTSNAVLSAGKTGFMSQTPSIYMSDFSEWWGAEPLTSEYNDTQMWPASTTAINAGQFIVSAQCEEPELAVAFADFFYDEDGMYYEMSNNGPGYTQTEFLNGVKGMKVDPETKVTTYGNIEENPNMYSSASDYTAKKIKLWPSQTFGKGCSSSLLVREMMCGWPEEELDDGYPDISNMDDASEYRKSLTDIETFFRIAMQDTMVPFVETGFPGTVYLDAETALQANNLHTVIKEYAEQESAKFITGARPLDELDAYFTEIERLGATEYVQIYTDYYESMK